MCRRYGEVSAARCLYYSRPLVMRHAVCLNREEQMKRVVVGMLILAATAAPLAAQQSTFSRKPSVFTIAPYVGYMNFGDYFETTDGVEFSNENGALYGAQASLDLGRYVSLFGNFGYSSSKFTFELGNGQNVNLNDVGVWLYDGGLQLRMPLSPD